MKQHLLSLTAYNFWANMQFSKMLNTLSVQQQNEKIAGSFDSIQKTAVHISRAEYIWVERLNMTERIELPENFMDTPCDVALQLLAQQSTRLHDFVSKQFNDDAFSHEVVYRDLKNTSQKNTVAKIITHVCNHSTFHRGQLVNFMRYLGISKIEATDYIHYCRSIEK
jgi:uncharacterized damage-inducible protein DinB